MNQPQKTALLIIDMLNDYFTAGPLSEQRAILVAHINRLVHEGHQRGWPIIWVRQEFAPDLTDAFLVMRQRHIPITIAGTEGCQCLPELVRQATAHEVIKKRYSAFFRTTLDDLLVRLNVTCLVICGINTHACVRMAAIDAYQRDYEVIIPRECVASADQEHHEVSLRYLQGEIAHVQSLSEVLEPRA
jgi:maleamate amidohydrolase